jgi:hypothetical protein
MVRGFVSESDYEDEFFLLVMKVDAFFFFVDFT